MGNKQEGRIAVLRWENFLIMAAIRFPQVLSFLIGVWRLNGGFGDWIWNTEEFFFTEEEGNWNRWMCSFSVSLSVDSALDQLDVFICITLKKKIKRVTNLIRVSSLLCMLYQSPGSKNKSRKKLSILFSIILDWIYIKRLQGGYEA